jgi:hypothetical protein
MRPPGGGAHEFVDRYRGPLRYADAWQARADGHWRFVAPALVLEHVKRVAGVPGARIIFDLALGAVCPRRWLRVRRKQPPMSVSRE